MEEKNGLQGIAGTINLIGDVLKSVKDKRGGYYAAYSCKIMAGER